MNVFLSPDRKNYRKWINIIPCLLISGSAQFLSGRRKAGVIWFLLSLVLCMIMLSLLLDPASTYTGSNLHWFDIILWGFGLAVIVDACRFPMHRIGFKGWLALLVLSLFLFFGTALSIRHLLFQSFKISSGSMQPTLIGMTRNPQKTGTMGDHILVNKTAYWNSQPQRGDIVIFNTSGIKDPHVRQDTFYIQRIVGLPGETISIDPPYLLVNGERISEPPIFDDISANRHGYSGFTLAQHMPDAVLKTHGRKFI